MTELKDKERDLFNKLCRYCAYRERANSEVVKKMLELEIPSKLQKLLLLKLQEENFLNELRFAKSYAGGKFRNNDWGRLKISLGLKEKRVSRATITLGLAEIDSQDYQNKIVALIHKKHPKYRSKTTFITRKKIASYLIGKGFEPNIVWELLKLEIPD